MRAAPYQHYERDVPEHSSFEATARLLLRIQAYWRDRNREFVATINESGVKTRDKKPIWAIQSNAVNGVPPILGRKQVNP
jgi:hypothetical protein